MVNPSPFNRQARREETSRRPEQGNPNALPRPIQAIACRILIAEMMAAAVLARAIPLADLGRDPTFHHIAAIMAGARGTAFLPLEGVFA